MFDGKMLVTPIYIKMDAHDQLLLSEGVCSQLGILEYHKNVWQGCELVSDVVNTLGKGAVSLTRIFHVSLSEPVIIPANKSTVVPVRMESDTGTNSKTKEVIPLFGVLEALLSDRGTNLLSLLMSDVRA